VLFLDRDMVISTGELLPFIQSVERGMDVAFNRHTANKPQGSGRLLLLREIGRIQLKIGGDGFPEAEATKA